MRDFTRTALNVSISHTNVIKGNPDGVIDDHAKVYQAIASGNAERAKNAMFLLIDEALSFIEQKLEKSDLA
jgi:DNA-binding GntR family transcriptional regulator